MWDTRGRFYGDAEIDLRAYMTSVQSDAAAAVVHSASLYANNRAGRQVTGRVRAGACSPPPPPGYCFPALHSLDMTHRSVCCLGLQVRFALWSCAAAWWNVSWGNRLPVRVPHLLPLRGMLDHDGTVDV